MATYPDGIVEFREIENLPGIAFDEADKTTVFAEDIQKADAEIVAIEETIGANPTGPFATVAEFLSEMSDQIQEQFETINDLTALVDTLRLPVGSIYTNADSSTNPATLLGYGTWAAFGQGRVLVGKASSGTFGTNGATGGEETHTLTESEMPSHTHGIGTLQRLANAGVLDSNANNLDDFPGSNGPIKATNTPVGTSWSGSLANTGGGGAHNNLQPYIVVYMWKRTA